MVRVSARRAERVAEGISSIVVGMRGLAAVANPYLELWGIIVIRERISDHYLRGEGEIIRSIIFYTEASHPTDVVIVDNAI